MVSILLWIIGLVVLCRGKAYLGKGRHVDGRPARAAGAVMMMALPLDWLLQFLEIVARAPRLAMDWLTVRDTVPVLILAVDFLCAFIADLILRSHSFHVLLAETDETPRSGRSGSRYWLAAIVEFACHYRWLIGLSMAAAMMAASWIPESLGIRSEPEGPAVFAELIIAGPICCLTLPLMLVTPWLVIVASRSNGQTL